MTTASYDDLRDRIAVRLCNWYHFPASSLDNLMGWAPMFQRHADELIAMVRSAVAEEIPLDLEDQAAEIASPESRRCPACGHIRGWPHCGVCWRDRRADSYE